MGLCADSRVHVQVGLRGEFMCKAVKGGLTVANETTMQNAVMWRVKYAEGNASGSGSSGDWAYYEDYDRMERELFDALLNADCGDGGSAGRINFMSKILRRRRRPDLEDDGTKWRRYRVIEVAYLRGDEWVPVKVSWTPPSVNIEEG